MRFMMLVKATPDLEAGLLPYAEANDLVAER
jgi:hypothetical protein